MNDKQILDRLESINLSLRQKKDLIDVIKDITANSGGGGNAGGSNGSTSTDKDALTILVDTNTKTVTVNDKQFLISSINNNIIEISNKELYNSLFNTDMPFFIKATSNDGQIAGYATCVYAEYEIQLSLYIVDTAIVIVVHNQ